MAHGGAIGDLTWPSQVDNRKNLRFAYGDCLLPFILTCKAAWGLRNDVLLPLSITPLGHYNRTPLMAAVIRNDLPLVSRMCEAAKGWNLDTNSEYYKSFDTDTMSPRGSRTALMYAAENGCVDAVRKLLDAGADSNDHRHDPLKGAISQGNADAAHALLYNGGRLHPYSYVGMFWQEGLDDRLKDPAKMAARAALVVELGTKKLVAPLEVLFAGVTWGIVEAVTVAIDEGLDALTAFLKEPINGDDRMEFFSSCILGVAVVLFPRLDRAEFINEMMEQCDILGSDARDLLRQLVGFPDLDAIDGEDNDEASAALFCAVGTGDFELAKMLLRMERVHLGHFGYGPWCWDKSTTTHAAACGHRDFLRFMLDNPPDIFEAIDLEVGLVACAMVDDVEYATRLLAAGTIPRHNIQELNGADGFQSSALRVACTRGNVSMVKLLLENGAKLTNMKTSHHPEIKCAVQPEREYAKPPLPPPSVEEEARRIDVIRLLVSAGASAADSGVAEDPLYLRAFPAGADD